MTVIIDNVKADNSKLGGVGMLRQSVPAGLGAIALALSLQSVSAQAPRGGDQRPGPGLGGVVELPAAINPPGLTAYLTVPATGVQIYTCGRNAAGAWAWIFKGPEAELFDTQQKSIGKHYGGPRATTAARWSAP